MFSITTINNSLKLKFKSAVSNFTNMRIQEDNIKKILIPTQKENIHI